MRDVRTQAVRRVDDRAGNLTLHLTMTRTKIIATMGPAVADEKTLQSLFEAGVDICRLNFSHGDFEQHGQMLKLIRDVSRRVRHPVAVLGDLCGPKIRLGKIEDVKGTGGMPVEVGDEIAIQREPMLGKDGRVSTILETFVDDVQVGDRVLIEDGLLRFVATDKTRTEIRLRCTVGGILKSSKGINLPNTIINVPSVTDRDFECVDWAVQNELDYLALSFVRRADDLKLLRGHLQYRKRPEIGIIAKIEKAEALQQIDQILSASDGLMVARGDLGVEMDVAQVPIIQKDLIRRCQRAGKPVIVATQMLQSMVDQASPTRAEVSDVANAIFDGTDAVMLSAETSVGKFPLGAVHTMAHVSKTTQTYLDANVPPDADPPTVEAEYTAGALARGAWRMAQDANVKLIVIWSQHGKTARVFSKHHFHCPIVSLSSDATALRRMAIHYGVFPYEMPRQGSMNELIAAIDQMVIDQKFAQNSDRIIIVAGWSPAHPDTMNGVIVHTVGEKWSALSPT
jgi:pyruvate kinase